jgi:hypothetical protein
MEIRGSLREEFIDTPSAKEAVLFANEPGFLVDRLQKDTSVSYVASALSTDEIIEALSGISHSQGKNAIDFVRAYIFLVSLSLKDDLDRFKDRINEIDLSKLQWGDQIRSKVLGSRVSSSLTEVKYVKGLVGADLSSNLIAGIVSKP